MIWNYNQRPHHALLVLLIFAVLIIILLFIAQKSYSEELEVTCDLTLGVSQQFDSPYTEIRLSGNLYWFTLYGGIRTDVQHSDSEFLHFGPLRSVYDIGFKFNWECIEIGWYYKCTHRGDYATYEQWYQMRKPTENDYYIKFSFTR